MMERLTRLTLRHAPLWVLPMLFSAGCLYLDKNGKAADDGTALVCGILGIIAFFAGVENKKNAALAIVGVILILA